MKPKYSRIVAEAMVPALILFAACTFKAMALWASDSSIRVYPNPWRAGQNAPRSVTLDNLPLNSTVKILSLAGDPVKTLSVPGGSASWDLTNEAGNSVTSGVYVYVAKSEGNQVFRGKIAVIR